jgi:hypothetical protein
MSRKVFTAGEVLAAADVNNFLMDQTVMSFAGTAARGSAIPTPVEGMYTHLEDTDDLQFWNGSAWRTQLGMKRLVNENVTASTGYAIDNVFTSEFEHYKMIVRADDYSASNSIGLRIQFRKAGTTITASNYRFAMFFQDMATSVFGEFSKGLGVANLGIGQIGGDPSAMSQFSVDIFSPQVSTLQTGLTWLAQSAYSTNNAVTIFGSGAYAATDNFDGILLFPAGAGNWTGNVKIYGYRN